MAKWAHCKHNTRFRCAGMGKLPVLVLVSTSRPLFTPEKWLGYWVAWWLVITNIMKKIWGNIEKYRKTWHILPVSTCQNQGVPNNLGPRFHLWHLYPFSVYIYLCIYGFPNQIILDTFHKSLGKSNNNNNNSIHSSVSTKWFFSCWDY